ncbi:unnamed protein product [Hymenolepis diminuta]|nr:unnamed protein product [Hymenolepis diminuta]
MCDGVRQSPIPLEYGKALYDPNLKPVSVYQNGKFSASENFTMENNGHTLMVSLPSCKYFLQLNGKKDGVFCIKQFHFHWGINSSVGSEHTIEGKAFPLEMHIVTYDNNLYPNFSEASKGVDGLAVLGLVFHEDRTIPVQNTMLYKMGVFLQKVDKVKHPMAKADLPAFPVTALLDVGSANTKFYRYDGSLTTPPCTENVYWTVISTSIPVRPEQLNAMRYIEYPTSENLRNMGNNFRTPKQINPEDVVVPRVVFRSWNPASRANLSPLLLLSIIILRF